MQIYTIGKDAAVEDVPHAICRLLRIDFVPTRDRFAVAAVLPARFRPRPDLMSSLVGKVAPEPGAARGIGAGAVSILVREGYADLNTELADARREALAAELSETGSVAENLNLDVAERADWFLVSDAAAYITRQDYVVDGGTTAGSLPAALPNKAEVER
jgi:hypothetical protein